MEVAPSNMRNYVVYPFYFVSLSSGTHLFLSTTGEFNFEEYQEKIIHAPEFTHAI